MSNKGSSWKRLGELEAKYHWREEDRKFRIELEKAGPQVSAHEEGSRKTEQAAAREKATQLVQRSEDRHTNHRDEDVAPVNPLMLSDMQE